MKKDILQINADLKYIEFLLHCFDHWNENKTLKEIKDEFEKKFKRRPILLNQYFGIIRLMPLIFIREEHIREEYKKTESKLNLGDIKKIGIIRNAVAHNDFSIGENGYCFKNKGDKGDDVNMTYEEFQNFLHKIENEFYKLTSYNSSKQ